jgi:hypothetical protein
MAAAASALAEIGIVVGQPVVDAKVARDTVKVVDDHVTQEDMYAKLKGTQVSLLTHPIRCC